MTVFVLFPTKLPSSESRAKVLLPLYPKVSTASLSFSIWSVKDSKPFKTTSGSSCPKQKLNFDRFMVIFQKYTFAPIYSLKLFVFQSIFFHLLHTPPINERTLFKDCSMFSIVYLSIHRLGKKFVPVRSGKALCSLQILYWASRKVKPRVLDRMLIYFSILNIAKT